MRGRVYERVMRGRCMRESSRRPSVPTRREDLAMYGH